MAMTRILISLLTVSWSIAFGQLSGPLPDAVYAVQLGGRIVPYQVQDGWAVTEGDIILGSAAEMEAFARNPKGPVPRGAVFVADASGRPKVWADGVIPYTIAPGLTNTQAIADAMAHWQAKTPVRFVQRITEVNYVDFVIGTTNCSASVGMIGGRQTVALVPTCNAASVIHELGHTAGLWHEQQRNDRNRWLTLAYENLAPNQFLTNYWQILQTKDAGYFDYGSIMMYSAQGNSLDYKNAMDSVPQGIPLSGTGLSAGDVDAIWRAYGKVPTTTTITSIPEGLAVIVDGQPYTTPQAFPWGVGTTHTIAVNPLQTGNRMRNQFVRWTDGGAAEHAFTTNADQTVVAAEFQQYFQVIPSPSFTTTLTPTSPDGYYAAGTTLTLQAKPNPGTSFLFWAGIACGCSTSKEKVQVVVRGSFQPIAFSTNQPTTTIDGPEGAQILVDGGPRWTPVVVTWVPGSTHTLSVTSPQDNSTSSKRLLFLGWEDGTEGTTRTVTAGTTPTTIRARFEVQYLLNTVTTFGGNVRHNGTGPAKFYAAGSTVTLEALPTAANTSLQYWWGDVGGSETTKTLLMDRPKLVLANFGPTLPFLPTNAASYSGNPLYWGLGNFVAPLQITFLEGKNLGPAALTVATQDGQGNFPTKVAGTRILFDGIPAPILYVSDQYSSVVVPQEVAGKSTTVITVERDGIVASTSTVSVTDTLPGIFTSNASGIGQVAAQNQDYSVNSSARPAEPGSVVVLYATGAGLLDGTLPNGSPAGTTLYRPLLPVSVRVGTQTAKVEYAGSAPFLVHGAFQVNVRLPDDLPSGDLPIALVVGNARSAPWTTIAVK